MLKSGQSVLSLNFCSVESFYLLVCLLMISLCLHCCTQSFSSCGEQELFFVAVHRLLIAVASLVADTVQVHGLQQLWLMGSRAQVQQLWYMDLVAQRHLGLYQIRDLTRVPCVSRQIIYCTPGKSQCRVLTYRFALSWDHNDNKLTG